MQNDKKIEMTKDEDVIIMFNDISLILREMIINRPLFGELSIKLCFHNGKIRRVVTSKEVSTLNEANQKLT